MARAAPRPEGNLPIPVTRFVGRREEITGVRRALQESRLVTLTDVGGVGKTRLALEVARTVHRAFPGGAWLVDLSAMVDPAQVPQAVASALGVVDLTTRPPADTIADHLRDSDTLVVLDNCEHLIDACAQLVAGLLTRGLSNRAIAAELVIAQRTVDGHVERILAKLGFTSRAQVAAWLATRAARN